MKTKHLFLLILLSIGINFTLHAQFIKSPRKKNTELKVIHTPKTQPYTKTININRTQALSPIRYYTNTENSTIQSPTKYSKAPEGATALCHDGTYSFSQNSRGTCSHHGGVARWL